MARSRTGFILGSALAVLAFATVLSACADDDLCEPGTCVGGQERQGDDDTAGAPACAAMCSQLEEVCGWSFAPGASQEGTTASCLGMCAELTNTERACMAQAACDDNVHACLDHDPPRDRP